LAFAAAILASGQVEMIAQDGEQAGLGIGVYAIRAVIDGEMNSGHGEPLRTELQNDYFQIIYPGVMRVSAVSGPCCV
jgi:hypothetical protein